MNGVKEQQYIPQFFTGELKTPKIEADNERKSILSNEQLENVFLEFQDDPMFKFLPYPRWFRNKHKTLLNITDDERQQIKEAKEEMNVKLAYETNMKNAGVIKEIYDKKRIEILARAKKRLKINKRNKKHTTI